MKKILSSRFLLLTFILSISLAYPQERVRIATYNILNYPNQSSTKNPRFQTVIYDMNPDILVVEEILSQSAVNQFKNDVLGEEYLAGDFINGPDTDNAIFYKDSLFQFISTEFINPSQGPRYISVFKLFHKITLDTLIIYAAHFKASSGTSNENIRLNEAATLRFYTNALLPNTDFVLVGDLNLYRSTEPAYEELLVQDGSGYFLDPLDRPGNWHDGIGFADIHTQSTRIPDLGDGGSTNGLDDRFDFILVSQSVMDEGGIDYITDTYWAYGNDGQHFNLSIHDPPNDSVSTDVAIALYLASDHLPVKADFEFGVTSDVNNEISKVNDYLLHQNYPNPFNPSTNISFTIPLNETGRISFVRLVVYDLLGNKVATLLEGEKPAGDYKVTFNASSLPSGVYFYQLLSGSFTQTRKMLLMK